MKLTKQRLKEIIKEELAKLAEAPVDPDVALLARLKQAYPRRAAHVTLAQIKKVHPSYKKGDIGDILQGL